MTAEELAERIRERKERLRKTTVEQALARNLVYDRLGGLALSVDLLDEDQAKLSAIILKGGDTDQVVGVDRSADLDRWVLRIVEREMEISICKT